MASSKIKGITVEIGGDTTKLGKALDNSEKQSRSLQGELRQIDKLLKFDSSNIELLTQRQSALAEMVDSTSDKLNTLKEAEAQVIAQFERGEIAEDQLRAFQREIIKCESDLEGMRGELYTTEKALHDIANGTNDAEKNTEEYANKLKEAEQDLKDFGESAREAYDQVKNGALAIGGAAVAGAGYALKMSTEFDQAFNTLQTQTGATAEEMAELEESIKNIYSSNFGESIQDVAESMSIVKQTTNLTGKELESVTQNALLMRDTFGFEVNESIRAVNSLMDQFGISADEAYNLVAQGAQKGLNQNDDLLDTINEYSVQFQSAGYSAEDMFNMLANGVESGTWSVDKLGDAVKEFNIRMSDGSAKDAIEALGFSWEGMSASWSKGGDDAKEVFNMLFNELDGLEDTTEGYGIGVGLLGTMYEDLGQNAVLALSQTEGEISKTSDALKNINDVKYDDIGSALQGLGRTLQTDLVDPLGDELKPVVEDAIGYVRDNGPQIKEIISQIVSAVGEFVGFIVNNGSTILSVIAGIGGAFILWNVGSMIATVVGAISSLFTLIKGGTSIMTAFNLVLNANPIGILVTLIGGLIIALITLFNTNDGFRTKVLEIWENVKNVASNIFGAIATFFTETIPNAISAFVDKVKSFFSIIVDFVKNNWQALLLMLVNPFAGAFALIYNNCEGFRNFVNSFVESVKNFFINAVNGIIVFFTETIPNAISAFVEKVKNFLSMVIDFVKNNWQALLLLIVNPFAGAFALLYNNCETFRNFVNQFVESVKNFFINAWNAIVTFFTATIPNFFAQLVGWLASILEKIVSWNKAIRTKVINAIKSLITSVVSHMKQLPGKIYNAISGAITRVTTWGANMKTKAVNAISTLVSSVVSKAKELPGKIYDAIKGAIDKVTSWGSTMKEKAKTAMSNVATAIKDALKSVPESMKTVGKNIVEGIWNGIKNATSWIKEKVGGFAKSILDGMKDALKIKSPSRVFRDEVGKYIAEGIGVGITENENEPISALDKLSKDMLDSTSDLNGVTLNRKLNATFGNHTQPDGSVSDLVELVSEYMPKIIKACDRPLLLDGKTFVGGTINEIDKQLSQLQGLKARRA